MTSLQTICLRLTKERSKKIVLIGGCFDLLHTGHTRILRKARSLWDILVIGINSDQFIKKTKGENRPIIPEKQREEMLNWLKFVDHVFTTEIPLYDDHIISKIHPDILVFGIREKGKIERRRVRAKNIELKFPHIKVVFLSSGIPFISTTRIENRIIRGIHKIKDQLWR